MLQEIGAKPEAGVRTRLANGVTERALTFTVLIQWNGEWIETEAIAYDGLPLLGTALMTDCSFYMEASEEGEVIIESLA